MVHNQGIADGTQASSEELAKKEKHTLCTKSVLQCAGVLEACPKLDKRNQRSEVKRGLITFDKSSIYFQSDHSTVDILAIPTRLGRSRAQLEIGKILQ